MWKGTVTEKGPEMWTPAHFSARLRLALGERPGATSEARPALGVVGSDLVLFSPSDSGARSSSCPFSFSSRLSSSSGQLSGAGSEGQVSKLSRRCGGCFADLFLLSRESSVPSGGKSQGLEVYPVPRPPHTWGLGWVALWELPSWGTRAMPGSLSIPILSSPSLCHCVHPHAILSIPITVPSIPTLSQ